MESLNLLEISKVEIVPIYLRTGLQQLLGRYKRRGAMATSTNSVAGVGEDCP